MIQVIAGHKGSGKTKRLIDIANEALKSEHGVVAFLDDDKRYMYDLRHEIRFVDAGEYAAMKNCSAETFFGFVSGMLAANFDMSLICVDSFLKLVSKTPLCEMEDFFANLNKASEASKCNFVLNISCEEDQIPAFLRAYMI